MADDLSRSPSVRMSKELDQRLNIAAAHEDMNKTAFIRAILRASVGDIEDNGLDEFVDGHDAREEIEA